ncbi:MAG: hypothetical protein FK734_17940 [Asgard group archaeon]|nr:hypothetical protein [Asgard group archaeon]
MEEQKSTPEEHLENTRKITKIILSLDDSFKLPNGWGLKELLIHLWSWDDQMINGCNAKLNGTCDDFKFDHQHKGIDYSQWNDLIINEKKNLTLAKTKKLFKDTREEVIALFDKIISQPETITDEKNMFRNENIATLWMHDKQHLEKGGIKIDF